MSNLELKCCQEFAFPAPSTRSSARQSPVTYGAVQLSPLQSKASYTASRGDPGTQVVQTPSARGVVRAEKDPAFIQSAVSLLWKVKTSLGIVCRELLPDMLK